MIRARFITTGLSCFVMMLTFNRANANELPFKLDEPLARSLVSNAECGSLKCLDSLDYEGDDSKISPPFFIYTEEGLVAVAGYFAVNPWTGSVWDLWDCKEISTPESRKAQAGIRKKFTKEELGQYDHLAALKPACMN